MNVLIVDGRKNSEAVQFAMAERKIGATGQAGYIIESDIRSLLEKGVTCCASWGEVWLFEAKMLDVENLHSLCKKKASRKCQTMIGYKITPDVYMPEILLCGRCLCIPRLFQIGSLPSANITPNFPSNSADV